MSMSDATELAVVSMLLKGTDPSYRAGATLYFALFTADPTEAGGLTNEVNYTSYVRLAITKATAWTSVHPMTNAVAFNLATCTGGSATATHWAVVDTGPTRLTAVNLMVSGRLNTPLIITNTVVPQFAIGAIQFEAD